MPTGPNKTYLIIAAYVIFLLAVAFFALSPSINSLKSNRSKLASKQTTLDQTYKKMESLQKASKDPETFKRMSDTVQNYWPDNLDVSYFIVQTENLAKTDNLIIENFSVAEPKTTKSAKADTTSDDSSGNQTTKTEKKSSVNSALFTFTSKAPYGSILNLIKGLEGLPRFNSVSMVSLSADEDNQINLRLTGNIYYGK